MSVQFQDNTYYRGDAGMPDLPVGNPLPDELPTQGRGNAIPRFYKKSRCIDEARGIYRSVELVDVLIPGDTKSLVTKKVTDVERRRWPREYQAFLNGTKVATDGTPLEFWGGLEEAQILSLKANNIFSVEQLAGLSDTQIQNVGSMLTPLVRRAQAHVAAKNSPEKIAEQQAATIAEIKAQNELLMRQVQQQGETIRAMNLQIDQATGNIALGIQPAPVRQGAPMIEAAVQPPVMGAFGPIGVPVAQGDDRVTPLGTLERQAVAPQPGEAVIDPAVGMPKRSPGRPRKAA